MRDTVSPAAICENGLLRIQVENHMIYMLKFTSHVQNFEHYNGQAKYSLFVKMTERMCTCNQYNADIQFKPKRYFNSIDITMKIMIHPFCGLHAAV